MKSAFRACFLASVALCAASQSLTSDVEIETVSSLNTTKYIGRWYQVYGNAYSSATTDFEATCTAADYALDEATGNITVTNSGRSGSPCGPLMVITGYVYGANETEPGKRKLHLEGAPFDGDYWIARLGPEAFGPAELYDWSIVTESEGLKLFVLTRDLERFDDLYNDEVLAIVEELGFTTPMKEPVRVVQRGCPPFDPDQPNGGSRSLQMLDLGLEAKDRREDLASMLDDTVYGVTAVTELDLERYYGRWYQAFGSPTAYYVIEDQSACVTVDYSPGPNSTVSVLNSARAGGLDGDLTQIDGFAYYTDPSRPGELTVHFDATPFDSPYWVLGLGDKDQNSPYEWSIVSDPVRAFLFVLVRDIEAFIGSSTELEVLTLLETLGFTSFWNAPMPTVHEGCKYTESPSADFRGTSEEPDHVSMKLVNLKFPQERGLMFGPAHASCKVVWSFPSNGCQDVSDALVAAAESMSGFANCNGGNKCGYTVTQVDDTGIELVHETSVQHFRDTVDISFEDEGGCCQAHGFSTSQTWYAVLDNGVNYCNMHNLAEATGLMYEETGVSDATCTQHSSADCERY